MADVSLKNGPGTGRPDWKSVVTAASVLAAAVTLTYSITAGSIRPRVEVLEKQMLEVMVSKAETKIQLDAIQRSIEKLEKKLE